MKYIRTIELAAEERACFENVCDLPFVELREYDGGLVSVWDNPSGDPMLIFDKDKYGKFGCYQKTEEIKDGFKPCWAVLDPEEGYRSDHLAAFQAYQELQEKTHTMTEYNEGDTLTICGVKYTIKDGKPDVAAPKKGDKLSVDESVKYNLSNRKAAVTASGIVNALHGNLYFEHQNGSAILYGSDWEIELLD